MNIVFTILAVLLLLAILWFVVWHVADRIAHPLRVTFHYDTGAKARANLKDIINRDPSRFSWSSASTAGRSYLIGMAGKDPVAITAIDRRRQLFYR